MEKRYEIYKDSGVEWFNEIPEHWNMVKFRYKFETTKGLTITKSDLQDKGIACVNYGEIHSKYGFEVNPEIHNLKCVSEEYLETNKSSLLSRGDFVFADTSEDIKGTGNFTHLHSDVQTFAGYHTIIARLIDDSNYRYIAYFFDSIAFRTQIQNLVKGVKVYSITNKILKDTILFCPLKGEQTQIANYLDHKTILIDNIITQKEQLINKLKEQRQAIINEAVTKGLNPNVSLKNSGIEWLGEIPENWEVAKLKYVAECNKNTLSDKYDEDFKINYIEIGNVSIDKGIEKTEEYKFSEAPSRAKRIVKTNDIIISTVRTYLKAITTITEQHNDYIASTGFAVLTALKINSKFLGLITQSDCFIDDIISKSVGVSYPAINASEIMNISIPIPPKNEQEQIYQDVENRIKNNYRTIDSIKGSIEKLKEYRQSIISEAVTGKIDVRDWKPKII